MIALITAWFRSSWLSIAKWGGIALGVLLVLLKVRQFGKDAVRVETLEKDLENAKEVIRQDRTVAAAPIDGMRERLDAALRRKRDS